MVYVDAECQTFMVSKVATCWLWLYVDAECQTFLVSKVATCWLWLYVDGECQTFMVSKVASCWLWHMLMESARHSWLVRWLPVGCGIC